MLTTPRVPAAPALPLPSAGPLADSSVDPASFRAAMRRWASSVAVVAVRCGGRIHGATATAVASLSDAPPTVLVSLHVAGQTHALIECADALAISVLADDRADLADRFAGRAGSATDRFEGVPYAEEVTGAPILDGAAAFLDGRVERAWTYADHTVFVVRVLAAGTRQPAAPLLYADGAYRRLAL